ncbi:MAG: plasmid pRiA4b ORF-3 family protein [Chloroflexota bacterium]
MNNEQSPQEQVVDQPAAPVVETAVYQMKVTMRHTRPPIWRRFLIRNDATLYELHLALQVVLGWRNTRLYQFLIDGVSYSDSVTADDLGTKWGVQNGEVVHLHELVGGEKAKFLYIYNFGHYWEHELLVERMLPFQNGEQYPLCLKGKRACPPEEVGGPMNYTLFLRSLAEGKRLPAKLSRDSRGFDPEAFDLAAVNEELKQIEWVSSLLRRTRGRPRPPIDKEARLRAN